MVEECLGVTKRFALKAVSFDALAFHPGNNRSELKHFVLKLIDPKFQQFKAFERCRHCTDSRLTKEAGDDSCPIR